MPEYSFQKKDGRKKVLIYFSMSEAPSIGSEIEHDGETYVRIIECPPNASFDTKIDIFDPKDFVRKTKNKVGTIGDMMDRAEEHSELRKKRDGVDKIKEGFEEDWSKKRKGRKMPKKSNIDVNNLTEHIKKNLLSD